MHFTIRVAGAQDRAMIDEAIAEYHKRTCVKWVPRKSTHSDYVYFTNSNTGDNQTS